MLINLNAINTDWVNELKYPEYQVNVKTHFNASGDGQTYDTVSIQNAIDHVSTYIDPVTSIPGGIVYFPRGHYLTGAIFMKSNSFLYLSKESTIYAATNWTYYPPSSSEWILISADKANNIGIFGEGIINGQSHKYIQRYDLYLNKFILNTWEGIYGCKGECRPRLIQFIASINITLNGTFSLINSPDWTSHYISCTNVYIQGINVWNDRRWPNGDGIDPDNVQNMIIRNVRINTGDDSICFKSERDKYGNLPPTSNILVENVWISSHSSAIKFGSATQGIMNDILIRNITITDSNRGLGLQMRDNGEIYNITYQYINIETRWWDEDVDSWWGDGDPIWITAIARHREQNSTGTIHDIRFKNINIRSENGIFISGIDHPDVIGFEYNDNNNNNIVYNIEFEYISMILDKWDLYEHPSVDYRPSYGLYAIAIPTLVNGLRIEYSNNITVNQFQLTFIGINYQWFWKDCYDVEQTNTNNIVFNEFTCINNKTVNILHKEL